MGAWFYMTAVGNFVAGKIGEATGGESGEMTQGHTLSIYWYIGLITIGIGGRARAVKPIVEAFWMHLDTLDRDVAMREALDAVSILVDADELAGQSQLAERRGGRLLPLGAR